MTRATSSILDLSQWCAGVPADTVSTGNTDILEGLVTVAWPFRKFVRTKVPTFDTNTDSAFRDYFGHEGAQEEFRAWCSGADRRHRAVQAKDRMNLIDRSRITQCTRGTRVPKPPDLS